VIRARKLSRLDRFRDDLSAEAIAGIIPNDAHLMTDDRLVDGSEIARGR